MFIYKSGRFGVGNTSFALPHECIVDTLLPVESHHGLMIKPPDESFHICVEFYSGELAALDSLRNLVESWSKPVPIRREEYACGTGWSVVYGNNGCTYHDLRFDMKEPIPDEKGRMLRTLEFLTCAASAEGLGNAIRSSFFMELMNSIQL